MLFQFFVFDKRSCRPVDTAAVKWKTLVTDAASQGAMSADQFKGLLKLSESSRLALVKKSRIHDAYDVEHSPFARGKFAAVRRSTHRVSGVAFAAKFVRRRRRASEVLHEILHEVAILELARAASGQPGSERIVRLHEVFETPTETAMVLEMVPGGELQRLIDAGETISEPEVRRMLRQVLEAVSFLHDRNIAHLDLKPQNILLTGPFPGCDVKLCDFGISRLIEPGVEVREVLGTPDYVAPEVLQYEPISLRTDMWSVGVLAYVLLSGHSPFGGDTKQETFCNISQGQLDFPEELFGDVSQPALDFISALLIVEASERLSSRASMQHPWLSPPSGTLPDADVQQVIIKRSSCEKDINGFSNKVLVLDKKMMC
ncbi:death-associated protein kinase related-like isoform X2 [Amphibalanus amphitrite]|uniref:death-associated protein kinase related-like isoform X2 n=2 Tax=Amphibalanus amphitrite TaxID=1232801 RepID=UPI001C904587|nr:death-associated protein kinase related-like isoform X2 [Amphibalanus amphitrite]